MNPRIRKVGPFILGASPQKVFWPFSITIARNVTELVKAIRHGGESHSLVTAGFARIWGTLISWPIGPAVLSGYLSHLGVDLANQSKVMLFWLILWDKLAYVKPKFPRWKAEGGKEWLWA